nr:immunoglobulin light chain junction region [Macaca mulatta]MOW54402.1 immunoglobulin light chain junction region [Macaca mulatta]MOW56019.1 immunoglobulin light chain junction region [Macaca mulatta]
CQQGKRHPFTF